MQLAKSISQLPIIGAILVFLYRCSIAFNYIIHPFGETIRWLFRSKETTNFTYEITPSNKHYLAALIADVVKKPYEEILGYIVELEHNAELKSHIRTTTSKHGRFADLEARYGRRVGWYAIARAVKPKVIVETGIDKGLGSCVLTAALAQNAAEGFLGFYYGTDINPQAGYLLSGIYQQYGKILYGDSITALRQLQVEIDLFINDSDHSSAYEREEYATIQSKLSPHAIILGDNAHCTEQLLNFALATNRQFHFFHERPQEHWYPGGGIGIAFTRTTG